jgi:hypothetical protein
VLRLLPATSGDQTGVLIEGRYPREEGDGSSSPQTAISIDLHALEVAEQSMEREIEEFWRRMGKGKRNGDG